ncbi:MAG: hypothetical protein MRJ96_02435 [Nitrospirales bacterium]|nr:hypothetical protein [Nitrospirales bacterium]
MTSPVPRLSAVLELPAAVPTNASRQPDHWAKIQTLGVATLSDATGPHAAPVISPAFLSRLTQRAKVNLEEQCSVPNVRIMSVSGTEPHTGSTLIQQAKHSGLEFFLLVLFSSTEVNRSATFGESRMMTQMPGTTTDNHALVELALVDVAQGMIVQEASAVARESMDRLQVPLGEKQPTLDEALDILRANAGQQALDKALSTLTDGCRSA